MDARTIPDLLRKALEHQKRDAFLVKREGQWEPVSIADFAARVHAVAGDLVARGAQGHRTARYPLELPVLPDNATSSVHAAPKTIDETATIRPRRIPKSYA
jgi:long-subunit acyl-CoA synthetase (AMP-forming)